MAPYFEKLNDRTVVHQTGPHGEDVGIAPNSFKINLSVPGEINNERLLEQFGRVEMQQKAKFVTIEERGEIKMYVFEERAAGKAPVGHDRFLKSLGDVRLLDAGFMNQIGDELFIDEIVFSDSLVGPGLILSLEEATINRSELKDPYEVAKIFTIDIDSLF